MAELKVKITGDARDAVQAAQTARQQIVEQFAIAGREVQAQEIAPDFDTVFRQLTQFRIGLTQIARGDLGGIPNLIQGISLAGNQIAEITPKVASAAQAFNLLDSALSEAGATTLSAKTVFKDFQAAASLAANGTGREARFLRSEFQALGIDLTEALAKPEKVFRDFLTLLGPGRGKIQAGNILSLGTGQVQLLEQAGQAITQFEQAETAAAASAKTLSGGLSVATLAVGAFALAAVAAVAAAAKIALSFKDTANEAQRFADDLGITVDQVRLLQVASGAANVEFSKISQTFQQFQESTNKALNETGEQADKVRKLFAALGVDAKKAASDPLATYEQLVLSINGLTDASTKAAASKELLGAKTSDVARLFAILNSNSGELRDQLQSMLGTIGNNNQAVSQWNIETAKLSATWEGFKETIGSGVLPILSSLISDLTLAGAKTGLLVDDIRNFINELRGIDTGSGGIEFDFTPASDFANNEDKKTNAVKDALRERRKTTKQARDEAAREELRDLQNQLRTVDAEYQLANTRLRQRFDERLINETTFANKLVAIAEERQRAVSAILKDEEQAVSGSKLSAKDKTKELQRIAQERANLERETAAEIEKIQFDARQRERQFTEQLQREILATLATANDRKIALIEDQIDREILTNEAGQQRISEIILDGIRARIAAQQALVNTFPQGSQEAIIEAEKLKQLQLDLAAAEEAALIRSRTARQRDLQSRRQYAAELQAIQNDIAEAQVSQLETNADQNVNASVLAIQARAELERQLIIEQANQRVASLQDQISLNQIAVEDDAATVAAKLANQERLTELLAAEYDRRRELLRRVNQQEARDLQAQNATLKAVTENTKRAIAAGLAGSIAAYASGAQSIRQAAASFYDAALQPLTDYLNKKAVAYFQESVARFAIGDFVGGAKYGIAGAAMAAAAGFVGSGGAVSGAIAGTGGGGGGTSSLGANLTGTRQDDSTRSTEDRFRLHEFGPNGFVTTIVLKTDRAQLVQDVSTGLVADFQQGGMTKKIIRNQTHGEPIDP